MDNSFSLKWQGESCHVSNNIFSNGIKKKLSKSKSVIKCTFYKLKEQSQMPFSIQNSEQRHKSLSNMQWVKNKTRKHVVVK